MASEVVATSSVEVVADLDSWAQLTGEGEVAYASFKAYVATGLEREDGLRRKRSLEKVIASSQIAPGILTRWHEQYSWEARARAYDTYIAQVKGQALARRSNLYAEATTDLAAVCAIEANRLLKVARAGEGVFTGKELVKALEALIKLDRLQAGQSTDNIAVAVTDMSNLSDAEVEQMHALMVKAGGKG